MGAKSKTRYALLGMLTLQPKSGYDIKKDIEGGLSLFWSESFGQIYKVLKQLEQEKLVFRKHLSQEGRPNKDIYTITDKGKKELQTYLLEPPGKLAVRDEMMLKFVFGFNTSPENNIRLLKSEQQNCEKKLKQGKEKAAETLKQLSPSTSQIYVQRLVDMTEGFYKAKIKWCKESIRFLEDLK